MRRYALPILIVAMAGGLTPAMAQVRRSASVRTNASAAILQPAMITSSQDLTFVISASTSGALTLGMASFSAPTTTTITSTNTTTAARTGSGTTAPKGTPLLQSATGSLSGSVPAPAQASFTVAGDAGQSISVSVPGEVDLTREGGIETAMLTTDNSLSDGPQFLGGDFATTGTLSFNVGGQVTLASAAVASGTYNGVLAVVAQYN